MKRKLSILFICLVLVFASYQNTIAVEIKSDNEKVQWLIDKEYVKGRGEEGLELDKNITRAEAAKLLVAIEGETEKAEKLKDTKSVYTDVKLDHWANGYINQAKEAGYIKGYEDGSFGPEKNISYEEIITILTRIHGCFVEKEIDQDDWSRQFILFAEAYGILEGLDLNGKFAEPAIRELAFELIYNLYHSTGACDIVIYDPIDKPVEKSVENKEVVAAEKPVEKPADKPADKPVDKPAEKPAEGEKVAEVTGNNDPETIKKNFYDNSIVPATNSLNANPMINKDLSLNANTYEAKTGSVTFKKSVEFNRLPELAANSINELFKVGQSGLKSYSFGGKTFTSSGSMRRIIEAMISATNNLSTNSFTITVELEVDGVKTTDNYTIVISK